jgi:hypothetical protein
MILAILIAAPAALQAQCGRKSCSTGYQRSENCCSQSCGSCFACCGAAPYCGPFPRPLPGQYDSYKDNTRIAFWYLPPCAPRNDSRFRGYLYKGMWWDMSGVRYWAFRNNTENMITIEGLEGGEIKDVPVGDVVNIARGESYSFRIQAPARRFELFNSDAHNIEVFINTDGDIDYREELPLNRNGVKRASNYNNLNNKLIMPKF